MPFSVMHVLLTIIIVDLYRDYFTKHKKYFSLHTILLAGVAGLLPDIDILIKIFSEFFGFTVPTLLQHGGITHTLLFALIFLIPAFMILRKGKHKQAMYFFVIFFGIFFHILLDYVLGGGAHEGVMWFWPIATTTFELHLLLNLGISNIPEALDAILLLAWLWHEEIKHKISDFI